MPINSDLFIRPTFAVRGLTECKQLCRPACSLAPRHISLFCCQGKECNIDLLGHFSGLSIVSLRALI